MGACLRVACLAAIVASAPASADDAVPYDLRVDLPAVAVATAGWIGSEYGLKAQLAPTTCHWCDRNPAGGDALNGFDAAARSLRWKSPSAADTVSNVDAFALVPLAVLGLDGLGASKHGDAAAFAVDAMIVVEAVAWNAALNQAVKFSVGRERPFVHVLPPAAKSQVANAVDNNLSFYSGHSSLASAAVVAAGVLAHERGYDVEPLIWAIGVPLALSVGYLRIAADKHYLTDVLVGEGAGALVGYIVPAWFHSRLVKAPFHFVAGPGGVGLLMKVP